MPILTVNLKVLSATLKKYSINRMTLVMITKVFFPDDEELGEVNSETVNRVKALARKYIVSIATLGWAVLKEPKKQLIQPASI